MKLNCNLIVSLNVNLFRVFFNSYEYEKGLTFFHDVQIIFLSLPKPSWKIRTSYNFTGEISSQL